MDFVDKNNVILHLEVAVLSTQGEIDSANTDEEKAVAEAVKQRHLALKRPLTAGST